MRAYSNTISKFGLLSLIVCLPVWLQAGGTGQYLGWGNQLLGQRRYADAARYFGAVLKAEPRNEAAYRGLGYCYLGQQDQAHGFQYLEYALRLNPSDSTVRTYLGRVYQDNGNACYNRRDQVQAMVWWKRSLAINPNNAQLYAYVSAAQQPVAAAPMSVQTPAASAPAGANESVGPTPGINPWVMGGTIAVLGAIMIFLF